MWNDHTHTHMYMYTHTHTYTRGIGQLLDTKEKSFQRRHKFKIQNSIQKSGHHRYKKRTDLSRQKLFSPKKGKTATVKVSETLGTTQGPMISPPNLTPNLPFLIISTAGDINIPLIFNIVKKTAFFFITPKRERENWSSRIVHAQMPDISWQQQASTRKI